VSGALAWAAGVRYAALMRAALLLLVAAASCREESPPVRAPTAEAYVEALCGFVEPCCVKSKRPDGGANCRVFFGTIAARSRYDVTSGEACLTAIRASAGKPAFCADISGAPACAKVFSPSDPRGTKQLGESCTSTWECAPRADEEVACRVQVGLGGWCQVQLRGRAGDAPCLATINGSIADWLPEPVGEMTQRGYLCNQADGLYCSPADRRCASKKPLGAACEGTEECEPSAFCDVPSRKCLARIPLGSPCGPTQVCAGTASCPRATMTCTEVKLEGAACTEHDQCQSGECAEAKCTATFDVSLALVCST
jgi:hypothetical protein